jgi:hypothetical protein
MKIIDAYILARTKRKTRRIRMALVTIVSSLLFAVLFFGALGFAGLQQSAARFKDYAYNGQQLTQVYSSGDPIPEGYQNLQKTINAAMDDELRARKVKITDELHNDPQYFSEFARRMNIIISERTKSREKGFEAMVQSYRPTGVYHMNYVAPLSALQLGSETNPDPYLTELRELTESGSSSKKFSNEQPPQVLSVEQEMLTPLLAKGQSFDWKQGDPYPVIVPYSYLQSISKKSFNGLSSAQKIAGYQELIKEYSGKTLPFCYRNTTAQSQLSSVLKYNHDVTIDKDASTKPLDVQNCLGFDPAVLKKAELLVAADPNAPKPLFPKVVTAEPAPVTLPIQFKIVGFAATMEQGPTAATDIFGSIFNSVNNWPAMIPVIMPQAIIDQQPYLQGSEGQYGPMPSSLFVNFANRTDQKRFVNEVGCTGDACAKAGSWMLIPFGSIKTALEDIGAKAFTFGKWIVLGIAVLASILVLLTISKLMSDNRREIAVFRALGARQHDIAQIYFTYGIMLAIQSLIVAMGLSVVAALLFSSRFADSFNSSLVQAVGAYADPGTSSLVAVKPLWLAGVAAVLFAATMIGVAIPVLLSRRRNLVSVMREE